VTFDGIDIQPAPGLFITQKTSNKVLLYGLVFIFEQYNGCGEQLGSFDEKDLSSYSDDSLK